jgi:pilus assembly protein CpaF
LTGRAEPAPRTGRSGGWATPEGLAHAVTGTVRSRLATRDGGGTWGPDDVTDEVRSAASARGLILGAEDLRATVDLVAEALWGLGPLAPLLRDPGVTDVLVNGADGVFVDRDGVLERSGVRVGGEPEVRALAVRLAAAAGRRLDDAVPWVDARLPGGLRLHAVLPAVCPGGTHLSIRRIRPAHLSLDVLARDGGLPQDWVALLAALVRAKRSFLISGGTGAGKTTLLGALLGLVPVNERIVLVEDVAELGVRHPHVVRLEARPPNVEGRGQVSMQDLVRQALRMRPDRLVVGECRGAEVRELLAALNTGHSGGCGTLHANAASEVPARVEALGALAGMSGQAVGVQFAAAVDAVLHVERVGVRRRLSQIAIVRRSPGGSVEVVPALTRSPGAQRSSKGPGWEALVGRLEAGHLEAGHLEAGRLGEAKELPT